MESFVAEKFKWWSFPMPPLRYLTGEMALVLALSFQALFGL
ncbi:hypothetical protein [Priestia flexa]|nr:hypothetical protein [Priestia flexa]